MKYTRLLTVEMYNTDEFQTIDAGFFPILEGIRYELYVEKDGPANGQQTNFNLKTFDIVKNPPLNFKSLTFVFS